MHVQTEFKGIHMHVIFDHGKFFFATLLFLAQTDYYYDLSLTLDLTWIDLQGSCLFYACRCTFDKNLPILSSRVEYLLFLCKVYDLCQKRRSGTKISKSGSRD